MDFKSCSVISKNFKLNDDGSVLCTLSNQIVADSTARAYIFANMFFYDLVEAELAKIYRQLDDKKQELIYSANIPADAVEQLYPPLSLAMREITGGSNALDGLIKVELSKIKPHISLILTPEEEENYKKLQTATFITEYYRFKNTVLIVDEELDEEKDLTFSPDFLQLLTPRAKRLLSPAIKVTALMTGGLTFQKFTLSPQHVLTYTWARNRQEFDEEAIKAKVKEIMSVAAQPV
ncbi:MAG: hypothetical protein LBQ05_02810 [Christensenellaceae bacterium]|jgi:hypothetical protein|nr:hypothetical protein [Christensenellaceae bacterium]